MANSNKSPDDFWDRLLKKVDSALRRIDNAEVDLEDVQMTISALGKAGLPVGSLTAGALATVESTLSFIRTEELLAAEAARGATLMNAIRRPNGDTKFIIDGLRSVTLPPGPAALLSVLCADSGPSEDEFVAWKSRTEIRHRLLQQTGKRMTSGALNNLVYRLRGILRAQALHPDFVRRDTRGLRFALRRKLPDAAVPEVAGI